MVNNSFQLIGRIINNFEKKVSGEYVFYEGRLEVEGRSGGIVREFIIKVSSSNSKISPEADYYGKVVVVSGYIDSYKFEDGGLSMKLVATDLLVVNSEDNATNPLSYADKSDEDLPF